MRLLLERSEAGLRKLRPHYLPEPEISRESR
jgi:hypothetical protein